MAAVGALAEQVRHGLGRVDGSGLLAVAEQARAASAWLASVELEAVSRLLRVQTREAQEEIDALAEARAGASAGARAGGPTGDRAGAEVNGWDWTAAEVACAFRLTTRQAEGRVELAAGLRDLPRVHALLRAGMVDEYWARVIAETLNASPVTSADPAWDEIVDLVCQKAADRTHVQIGGT